MMILQYQSKESECVPNATDVMVQIRTDDLEDFMKWLDLLNCWHTIKQSKKNMDILLDELCSEVK